MADKGKIPTFDVGPKGKKEVKKLLLRSKDPATTISNFQTTRSLHAMLAKAFGTTPQHESSNGSVSSSDMESLDTESVFKFLGFLGVSRFEVHKRIADSLQKQLEEEIRKNTGSQGNQQALLLLLKNSWHHATTVPEFRPILWALLKQLGEDTPSAVLNALAERDAPGSASLKHASIFGPLPPLLKRLVWEADWDERVPLSKELAVINPKEYVKLVQGTLLHSTLQSVISKYCESKLLRKTAEKFFVASTLERRILTNQRRALAQTSTTASKSSVTTNLLGKTNNAPGSQSVKPNNQGPFAESAKAVSRLRQLLGDATGGTSSYRPKLLHALLSLLMAHHGANAPKTLTGTHLHCTLVADILLSAGGALPKVYTHVHALARILDDAVRNGVFTDKDITKVQATLKKIYDEEHAEAQEAETKEEINKEKQGSMKKVTAKANKSKPLQRQLNRIITAGNQAMKESDPQNLFLNPVTDAIAPGYSKVIKKPMSISTMETKVEKNAYSTIDEWNSDVRLMFKNCVDYNRGASGQWFRGEANRQLKVFKDEIMPQARKLYQAEIKKRNPDENDSENLKRKHNELPKTPEIEPLEATAKKRKILETQEFTLSMPALASMLLADPFVVRLLLDRIMRSLRIDVLRGGSIPVCHRTISSLMQLLHMANFSTQICAVRGRRFLIPDAGLKLPEEIGAVEEMIPHDSLRRYLPILLHLALEAEVDKRIAIGGDLHPVADTVERVPISDVSLPKESPSFQVVVAVLEGLFVTICLPGNSQDSSLALTFGKFSKVLQQMTRGTLWDECAFFVSLVPAILRHKARLNRKVRDTIISTWMSWLDPTGDADQGGNKKRKKKGSIMSSAHEYFVFLLNEWAGFGNLLMPRDLLLSTALDLIRRVDNSESLPERKFLNLWTSEMTQEFTKIKVQYERLLNILPESHAVQFKETVGIIEVKKSDQDETSKDMSLHAEDESHKMDIA